MDIIAVTHRQLQAMLLPAVRYRQAFVVRGTSVDELREICRDHPVEVIAFSRLAAHEQSLIIVRLMRSAQRESAMVLPYSADLPRPVLYRVVQLRLVAK